jgi:hypothetical protein
MGRVHVTASLWVIAALGALSCAPEEVAPPAEEPVAPGWLVSRPAPEIDSFMDVVVTGFNVVESPIPDEPPEITMNAYAVGTQATLVRYEGAAWVVEPAPEGLPGDAVLESVSGVRNNDNGDEVVMAVGTGGAVLLRDSRLAASWAQLPSPTEERLFGVWVRSFGDAFIVGDNGSILRWQRDPSDPTNLGAVTPMTAEATQQRTLPDGTVEDYDIPEALKDVGGFGADDVFTVGPRGAVYHFDGNRWRRDDTQTNRPFTSVFTGSGLWATATDGVLFRRGGDGWDDSFRVPLPIYLQGVWAGGGEVVAVGMGGTVFHYENNDWTTVEFGEAAHLRSVDGRVVIGATEETPARRIVFAVGAGGRIYKGPSEVPPGAPPSAQ